MLRQKHFIFPENIVQWSKSVYCKLREVIQSVRDAMAKQNNEFDGQFKADCQFSSVPMLSLTLIVNSVNWVSPTQWNSFNIASGGNVEHKGCSQDALSISQLIMYNFRKQSTSHISTYHRHTNTRETPLVIYNSLKLYEATGSSDAIDDLHHLGLGISYLRTIDITKNLYVSQITQYNRDKVLVPPIMNFNLNYYWLISILFFCGSKMFWFKF